MFDHVLKVIASKFILITEPIRVLRKPRYILKYQIVLIDIRSAKKRFLYLFLLQKRVLHGLVGTQISTPTKIDSVLAPLVLIVITQFFTEQGASMNWIKYSPVSRIFECINLPI